VHSAISRISLIKNSFLSFVGHKIQIKLLFLDFKLKENFKKLWTIDLFSEWSFYFHLLEKKLVIFFSAEILSIRKIIDLISPDFCRKTFVGPYRSWGSNPGTAQKMQSLFVMSLML